MAHCCLLIYRWLSVGTLIRQEWTIIFFNWHHFEDKTINFESVAINLNVIALNRSKLLPPTHTQRYVQPVCFARRTAALPVCNIELICYKQQRVSVTCITTVEWKSVQCVECFSLVLHTCSLLRWHTCACVYVAVWSVHL